MRWLLRRAEFFADRQEGCRVLVVPIHIAQQTSELVESRPVDATVPLEAFLHPRPRLVEIPTGLGHTDNGHIEIAAQRPKYLLVGEIPSSPEEDQRVGKRAIHDCLFDRRFFKVSAKLITHRRQQFVLIVRLAARTEALVKRGGEDWHRNALVDGSLDRPPALTRV